ncbi:MAG: DUF3006 domain-containing protein [Eubacteriaceae bacterium]|nr:DUF3006 domain-containing protein [Eubacteriaceae bacterium]
MEIKKAVIDRIEGSMAVCELEDKSFININIKMFDYKAKEGDHILIYPDKVKKDLNYKAPEINLDDYFKN